MLNYIRQLIEVPGIDSKWLNRWLIGSLILHIIAAIFTLGFHHLDEHFQIMEFAAYKFGLGPSTDLAWEFHEKMRPTLQPFLVYSVLRLYSWLGIDNPFNITLTFRFLSAILAYSVSWIITLYFAKELTNRYAKKIAIIFNSIIWFLPYCHARFSSENWSGIFFWLAFVLTYIIVNKKDTKNLLGLSIVTGILLGISFIFRFQIGVMVGALLLWQLFAIKKKYLPIVTGVVILLVCALHVLLNHWMYGEYTIAAVNYLEQNLIQGKAANFGTSPWLLLFCRTIFITTSTI